MRLDAPRRRTDAVTAIASARAIAERMLVTLAEAALGTPGHECERRVTEPMWVPLLGARQPFV
jgi:hypothetical protein